MTVRLSAVNLVVDDHDAALGFYCGTLGLVVDEDVVVEGCRSVTVVAPDRPDVGIVLSLPHAHRSREAGEALAVLIATGELRQVDFCTGDLDRLFDALARSPGVEVLQEPIRQPEGTRDAVVLDPSGNAVRITQRRAT